MKRRSDYPAYLAMRAALAGVRVLPRSVALAAGSRLGRAARLLGLRRQVVDQNLRIAFPELDESARSRLAGEVFAHFGRMAVDSLRLSARGPDAVMPYVDGGDVVRLLEAPIAAGRGAIICTGHVGNWELAGAYLAARGFPIVAVVKPPSNPYVARHTEAVRRRLGIESVALPDARTAIPAALRANRAVALVADQGALRSNTWATFFGRPTKTPVGPGMFAAITGAPVYFGALVARPGGRYELVGELLEDAPTDDVNLMVQRAADRFRRRLEALVRTVPEQYLWTHRLWKQAPPPAAP